MYSDLRLKMKNPVAKNCYKFNKPKVYKDRKKMYNRKNKKNIKEE